jgi:hypothetical protein
MPLNIYGYDFEGPYSSPDQLPEYAGVYAVWYYNLVNLILLAVRQSENVQARLKYHDRKNCWEKYCSGLIYFYVAEVPDELLRGLLENKLRQGYRPLCGEK